VTAGSGNGGYDVGDMTYDSGQNEVFVANPYTDAVYIISDSTNRVVKTLNFTSVDGVVYDPAKSEIFVASTGSSLEENNGPIVAKTNSSLEVVSDKTDSVVADISLGLVPQDLQYQDSNKTDGPIPSDMVYDSGKGEVFVEDDVFNYSSGASVPCIVSVVSDSTNAVVTNVNVGGGTHAEGMAYDPAKGEVFVADSNGTDVAVISDATDSVVANIGIEPQATGHQAGNGVLGVAYDPAADQILVANNGDYLPNTVTAISDSTDKVLGTIDVGYGPGGIVYDSAKGEIFVANEGDNTISVISAITPLPEFPGQYALPLVLVTSVGAAVLLQALTGASRKAAKQNL
jgi:DNA-binding beta-propeller fold protein YncE